MKVLSDTATKEARSATVAGIVAALAFLLFEFVFLVPLRTLLISVLRSMDIGTTAIAVTDWLIEALLFGAITVVILVLLKVAFKKLGKQARTQKVCYELHAGIAAAIAYFFYWAVLFNYVGGIIRMSFFDATLWDASGLVYFAGIFAAPFLKAAWVGGTSLAIGIALITISKKLKKESIKQEKRLLKLNAVLIILLVVLFFESLLIIAPVCSSLKWCLCSSENSIAEAVEVVGMGKQGQQVIKDIQLTYVCSTEGSGKVVCSGTIANLSNKDKDSGINISMTPFKYLVNEAGVLDRCVVNCTEDSNDRFGVKELKASQSVDFAINCTPKKPDTRMALLVHEEIILIGTSCPE